MKKVFAVGVAVIALCDATAFATDLPKKAPVFKAPDESHSWTGFYAGVNAGVGVAATSFASDSFTGDRTAIEFSGGGQVGFNWQFNPLWVAGIEADLGHLGINRAFEELDTNSAFGVKADWYSTVRARLGYTSGPSLFYATGGVAFVNLKNNVDDLLNNDTFSNSKTATGWTAGGGIETLLGGNWSAKAEYVYIDPGANNVSGTAIIPATTRFDNRFHVLRYGLNYRFGGPGVPDGALPAYDWSGFYVGANAGAGLSQVTAKTETFGEQIDLSGAGLTAGVQAGYNWRLTQHGIVGFEADIGYLGIDRSISTDPNGFGFAVKTDWFGTVRGRLGYHRTRTALRYWRRHVRKCQK